MPTETTHINVVIPMAGDGTRFRDQGYDLPKPFIDVDGKPMIARVLDNIALPHATYILIARTRDYEAHPEIVAYLEKHYHIKWVMCDRLTEGAACTVLLAKQHIDNDTPLLLANSDQLVDIDVADLINDATSRNLSGSILTFPEHKKSTKWSYAELDDAGHVTKTAEKQPISSHATVGIYYYRTGSLFVKAAEDMIRGNDRHNNEFYVCPAYNYLINKSNTVGIYEIESQQMHGIGTPEDLTHYLQNNSPDAAPQKEPLYPPEIERYLIPLCLFFIVITCLITQVTNPRATFVSNPTVPTAWEYPATDMGAFFMRAEDPNFLPEDLYANSLDAPNPRWIFGYTVLALADLFSTDWYGVMFGMKCFFSLLQPCLIFLIALSCYRHHHSTSPSPGVLTVVALIAAWAGSSEKVFEYFSVALWHPAYTYAIPQNCAIMLSLVACLLYSSQAGKVKLGLLWIALCAATLMHPSSALFAVMCFIILHFNYIKERFFITFVTAYLTAVAILFTFFAGDPSLTTKEFIEHYIYGRLHFHYTPSRYHITRSWENIFLMINMIFMFVIFYGIFSQKKRIWITGALALTAYSGAIIVQYLFVELGQIKPFAQLGPSRFSMFGFWMVVACVLLCQRTSCDSYVPLSSKILIGTLVTSIILLAIPFTLIGRDDPSSWSKKEDVGLYEWIENKTNPDDVFVVPEMTLAVNIQLLAKRTLYGPVPGGPVVFNEGFMAEAKRKVENIFGSYKNHIPYEKWRNMHFVLAPLLHYNTITPTKILDIIKKDRMDYMIFKTSFGFPPQLSMIKPRYHSKFHTVYSTSDIVQTYAITSLLDISLSDLK